MSYDTMLWNLHGYVESPATDDGPELLPVDAPDAGVYCYLRSTTAWGVRAGNQSPVPLVDFVEARQGDDSNEKSGSGVRRS